MSPKTTHIIQTLKNATTSGVKKTRKEWACEFKTSYAYFSTLINIYGLHGALVHVRAEKSVGLIRVYGLARSESDAFVRVPVCALRASGMHHEKAVAYKCTTGKIVITRTVKEPPCHP